MRKLFFGAAIGAALFVSVMSLFVVWRYVEAENRRAACAVEVGQSAQPKPDFCAQ